MVMAELMSKFSSSSVSIKSVFQIRLLSDTWGGAACRSVQMYVVTWLLGGHIADVIDQAPVRHLGRGSTQHVEVVVT